MRPIELPKASIRSRAEDCGEAGDIAGLFTSERTLDEVQPILSPEHLVVNEEHRSTEHASRDSACGDCGEARASVIGIDCRNETIAINEIVRESAKNRDIADILVALPV